MSFISNVGKSPDEILKSLKEIEVSEKNSDFSNINIQDIKDSLKLFNEVTANNATSNDSAAIAAKKEILYNRLAKIIEEIEELQEKLQAKEDEINTKTNETTSLVTKVEEGADEYNKNIKKAVDAAIKVAAADNNSHKDWGHADISAHLQSLINKYVGNVDKSALDGLQDNLRNNKSEIAALVSDVSGLMDEKNMLDAKYTATNSTYKILEASLNQIGNTSASYKNVDTNTSYPIYTPEQAIYVADLNEKYATFANNTAKVEGGKSVSQNSYEDKVNNLKEKYGKFFNVKATGTDHNSLGDKTLLSALNINTTEANTGNATLVALSNALDSGLIEDMKLEGFTSGEIAQFFSTNFSGANFKLINGNFSVPFGHGTDAKKIYNTVVDYYQNPGNSIYKGALDTGSEYGNSISTNAQLEKFAQSYDEILTDLNNQGFTFKEAMYMLFDSEVGIFNHSGINYNYQDQNNNAHYSITPGGDNETAKMYKSFANKVYDIWGVKSDNELGSFVREEDDQEETDKPAEEVQRTDPLSLSINGQSYHFIIDRNNDNKFNNMQEFVGGNSATNWVEDLLSFDKDGDGILTDEELSSLMLLGTDITKTRGAKETRGDKDVVAENDYNIAYSNVSASSLGIKSIDLNAYLTKDASGKLIVDESKLDNSSTQKDVNNSVVHNDLSNLKINGQDIANLNLNGKKAILTRKDETAEHMKTMYSAAQGRSNTIGGIDVDTIVEESQRSFEEYGVGFSPEAEENYYYLKNYDAIVDSSEKYIARATDDANRYKDARKDKEDRKLYADKIDANWSSKEQEINSLLNSEYKNVSKPSNFMTLAKGIYARNINATAREIVEGILGDEKIITDFEAGLESNKKALKLVENCAKNNIKLSFEEAQEAIKEGKTLDDIIQEKNPEKDF